jgi:hypothetical protein
MHKICLADGREIEFMLRVMRKNEVVSDLVRQREIPGEDESVRQ